MISLDTMVASISAALAGIGLILAWWGLRAETKVRQLQILDNTLNNINQTVQLLYDKYEAESEDKKKQWDSQLFNQIEYFSFLVNNKFLKDKRLIEFFKDAIIMWYEEIFLKHYPKDQIENTRLYPEMKILYKRFKSRGLDS